MNKTKFPIRSEIKMSSSSIVLSAFLAMIPLAAQAQIFEEIVVTAQKREQNLQDVGVAVTAFTGEQISALGFSSSTDIVNLVPGVQIVSPNGGSSNFFTIRGVTQNDFTDHQESPVATYIDEAYVSQMSSGSFLLFDMERIEVLRGPQGTLFGRNATGGLVHFVTKKPTEELSAYAQATYGSFNQISIEGAVGGPISDKVSVRVAGATNHHDSVIKNRIGPGGGNAEDYAGRAQIQFKPTDELTALISVHGATSRQRAAQYQHRPSFVNADGLGEFIPDNVDYYGTCAGCDPRGYKDTDNDHHAGDYDLVGHNDIDTWGSTAKVEWSRDNLTITSITDFRTLEKSYKEDSDASPTPYQEFYLQSDVNQFSQELRAFVEGERYRWVGGVYFLNISGDYVSGISVPVDELDIYNPYSLKTRSWAAFTQAEYDISPEFTIIGGIRWSHERKTIDYRSDLLTYPDLDYIMELASFNRANAANARISGGNWSAKVQLDWRPVDGTLVYASWNRGIKAGGMNAPLDVSGLLNPDASLQTERMTFDDEVLYAYEIGVKTSLFNNRARLNLAGFYYDYNNYQAFDLQGLTTVVFNTDARIYGLDAELVTSPFDGLDVMLGASILNAKAFDVPVANQVLTRRIVLAPRYNINGMARYSWPMAGGTAAIQGDFKYMSAHYFNISNAPVTRESSYIIGNARVSYTTEDDRWEVAGFVKNITGKDYNIIGFDVSSSGYTEQFPGNPRWWGLSVAYRYN